MTIAADQITRVKFTFGQSKSVNNTPQGKEFTLSSGGAIPNNIPRANISDLEVSVYLARATNESLIGVRVPLNSSTDYVLSDLFPSTRDVTLTLNNVTKNTSKDPKNPGINVITAGVLNADAILEVRFTTDPNQLTNFREGSRTTPVDIENALDKNTMAIKSINTELKRSLKLGPQFDDAGLDGEIVGAANTPDLHNHILVFDNNGKLTVTHREEFKGDVGEHAIFYERLYYRGTTAPTNSAAAHTAYTPSYSKSTKLITNTGTLPNGWVTNPNTFPSGQNIYFIEFPITLDEDEATDEIVATKGSTFRGPYIYTQNDVVTTAQLNAAIKVVNDRIGTYGDTRTTPDNTASIHSRINRERYIRRVADRDEQGARTAEIEAVQLGRSSVTIPAEGTGDGAIAEKTYTASVQKNKGLVQLDAEIAVNRGNIPEDVQLLDKPITGDTKGEALGETWFNNSTGVASSDIDTSVVFPLMKLQNASVISYTTDKTRLLGDNRTSYTTPDRFRMYQHLNTINIPGVGFASLRSIASDGVDTVDDLLLPSTFGGLSIPQDQRSFSYGLSGVASYWNSANSRSAISVTIEGRVVPAVLTFIIPTNTRFPILIYFTVADSTFDSLELERFNDTTNAFVDTPDIAGLTRSLEIRSVLSLGRQRENAFTFVGEYSGSRSDFNTQINYSTTNSDGDAFPSGVSGAFFSLRTPNPGLHLLRFNVLEQTQNQTSANVKSRTASVSVLKAALGGGSGSGVSEADVDRKITSSITAHNLDTNAHRGILNLTQNNKRDIGASTDTADADGSIYARIAALKAMTSSGGATEEQLNELRHLIQIAESKIPEEYRVLKKPEYGTEDDTPHALGETINDLPEVAAIDPAVKADKIDFVIAEEAPDSSLTQQYQDVGDPVNFTRGVGSFPTTADVRMFHGAPKSVGGRIDIGGGVSGPPYLLATQGANSLTFDLPATSPDGAFTFTDDTLILNYNNSDIRASETAAGFRNRLDFVLDGNAVDAALSIILPQNNGNRALVVLAVATTSHSTFFLEVAANSVVDLTRINTANGNLSTDDGRKQVSVYMATLPSGIWQAMFGTDKPSNFETGRFRLGADSNTDKASFNVYRQEFRHLGGFEAQKMSLPNMATTIGRTLAENVPEIGGGATRVLATSSSGINAFADSGKHNVTNQRGPTDTIGRSILFNGGRISNASANRGYFALATRNVGAFNLDGTTYTLGGPAEFDVSDALDLAKTYDSLKEGDVFSELQITKDGNPITAILTFRAKNNNRLADFELLTSVDIGTSVQIQLDNDTINLNRSSNSGFSIDTAATTFSSPFLYRVQNMNIGQSSTQLLDLGTFNQLGFYPQGSTATGVQIFLNNTKVTQHENANQIVKIPITSIQGVSEAAVDGKINAHDNNPGSHPRIIQAFNEANTAATTALTRIGNPTTDDPTGTGSAFARIKTLRDSSGGGTITRSFTTAVVLGALPTSRFGTSATVPRGTALTQSNWNIFFNADAAQIFFSGSNSAESGQSNKVWVYPKYKMLLPWSTTLYFFPAHMSTSASSGSIEITVNNTTRTISNVGLAGGNVSSEYARILAIRTVTETFTLT